MTLFANLYVYASNHQTNEQYVAVFDPLDGSSNVDASIPVGTIFGMCVPHPKRSVVRRAPAGMDGSN